MAKYATVIAFFFKAVTVKTRSRFESQTPNGADEMGKMPAGTLN